VVGGILNRTHPFHFAHFDLACVHLGTLSQWTSWHGKLSALSTPASTSPTDFSLAEAPLLGETAPDGPKRQVPQSLG
jgi:hypothetical protein